MKASFLGICLLALLATACATTDSGGSTQSRSASRVFPERYERVYAAVLAAAKAERLAVVEADQQSGRVILANRLTSTGWVETITVGVSRVGAESSQVTVLGRPPAPMRDLPPNWGRIIDDRLGEFREAPSQRGESSMAWGQVLLARIGGELAVMRKAVPDG